MPTPPTKAPVRITIKTSTEPQRAFWASDARFRLFVGGVGSGKTHAGAIEVLRMPARTVGMVIAPNFRMLRDATLRSLHSVLGRMIVDEQKVNMNLTLSNGTTVMLRSADDPSRLRGPNLGWAWLDEAAIMDREVWDVVIGRLREAPSRAWLTTTPAGMNWVYDVAQRAHSDPDYAVMRASTRSNPYLPQGYVQSLATSYTSEYAAQEIDGEFLAAGGAIFKRDWFTFVTEVPRGLRWARYWDLAMSTRSTADYTASVAVGMAQDGTVYLRDMVRGRWEWPDARRVIIDTMERDGVGTHHAVEAAAHGLAAVQELRRDPRLSKYGLRSMRPDADKVSRALTWAARAEQGKIAILRGAWVADFLDEVCRFPNGPHDDQVDAVSGAMPMLRSINFVGVR
jgi:predicted phage terminase large subunit-like protein